MTVAELDALPFVELEFRSDMIEEDRAEREKVVMRGAAFVAHQLGGAGRRTYAQYLRDIGVSDRAEPMTKEERAIMIRQALEKARRIVALDQANARRVGAG